MRIQTDPLIRPWLRSMLFVPAHKAEWVRTAARHGADALIFDLEDSVPGQSKAAARSVVAAALREQPSRDDHVFVRANPWGSGRLLEDVQAVAVPTLTGFLLPKVEGPEDVCALDRLLTEIEVRDGLQTGHFEIVPLLETARSVELAYEILRSSQRIARVSVIAGSTPGAAGDLHRALGVDATREGDELSYASGRTLVAAKAAGILQVLGGMVVDVHDLDLLRFSLNRAKQHGAQGTMAIHPSHVPVIHEVFTPNAEEIADAVALLRCLDSAAERGDAATTHRGQMVDLAHGRSAARLLERARQAGIPVPILANRAEAHT